jgi:hypothetical protein
MTIMTPAASQSPIAPAVVAFELLTLPSAQAKQGLAVRAMMDAAAARLMIAGMTGACTGTSYSNGEIAQWMATIFSTLYGGDGRDLEWSQSLSVIDKPSFGAAYAVRSSLSTLEDTALAMREATNLLLQRAGTYCLVEYGYCDAKGQGPALADWTNQHSEKLLGRIHTNPSMSTTFMIFTDQRAALKLAKAESGSPATHITAPSLTPASIIAAAVALDPMEDED